MPLQRRQLILAAAAAALPAVAATRLPEPRLSPTPQGALEWVEAGSGPVLLLEAGLSETLAVWRNLLPLLAARHRVIAWNRPGFGRSEPRDEVFEPARHAEALRALLRAADVNDAAVLVGHAAGGLMAEAFARAHPDQVSALALIDPMAFEQDRLLAEHDRALALQVQAMTRLWPGTAGREMRGWDGFEAGLRRLPAYAGPTLALAPRRDTRGVPRAFARARREAARAAHSRFARGQWLEIEADAFVLDEAPELLARALLAWLETPPP